MKVAVFGASGNIGSRVVRALAHSGHSAIALLRDPSKSAGLPKGCDIRPVNLPNAEQLIAATEDADALLWLTAPRLDIESINGWYDQCTTALESALRANPDIRRVVHISSIGAGTRPGLGTVSYVGEVEMRINRLARNVVHLRPGYFMQNVLMNAHQIATQGVLGLSFAPNHDIPWISVTDIAQAACGYLTDESWRGQWYPNVMGPRNLTGVEAAEILSHILKKPVRFEQIPPSQLRAMFAGFGATPAVLDDLLNTYAALGDPDGVYATARTHDAFTPTTFEHFARTELVPILPA